MSSYRSQESLTPLKMSMSNSVVSKRGWFLGAILSLTLVCPPASAQLPLPQSPDLPVNVVNEPLPQPVEDVVESSPVGPVRDEVRRIVGDTAGGGPMGGPTGGPTNGPANAAAQPQSPAATPSGGGESTTGKSRANRQRRTGSRAAPLGRTRAATRARARVRTGDAPAADSRRAAKRRAPKAAADTGAQNPVVRTIEKIVAVVPTVVWIALGVLLALSAALGARTFVERRRAGELDRDRQRLIRDISALERALLPAVPEMLGALAVSVAHRASEGPAAGGDFYDVFELPGERVAILVGDISGHGPEALERTNSVRACVRERLEAGLSPRAALECAGRSTWLESDAKFATAVVAVHDPADGTLTYATAGHPAPIVVGRGAHEPIITGSSPPIGTGLRTGLRETRIPMPAGTAACLFTDGLLEARVSDDLMGREELTRFVDELGPEQYADSLLAQVIAVADKVPDDMAVCVLRPVADAETAGQRMETLMVDSEDIALGLAARFLEACEVPEYQVETCREALSAATAASGGAVLEVTIDESGPHVRVTRADAAYGPATI